MFLLWLRQLPGCGDQTPALVPPPAEGRSSPTNTPGFPLVPSSYRVLHGAIYFFPLVRYPCSLSARVLHALLCLKVYSWCIRGERRTPRPPALSQSCSRQTSSFFLLLKMWFKEPEAQAFQLQLWHVKSRIVILILTRKSWTKWKSFF